MTKEDLKKMEEMLKQGIDEISCYGLGEFPKEPKCKFRIEDDVVEISVEDIGKSAWDKFGDPEHHRYRKNNYVRFFYEEDKQLRALTNIEPEGYAWHFFNPGKDKKLKCKLTLEDGEVPVMICKVVER